MTRKENLLVEIYNLRNQIAEMMGIKKQNVNVLLETININKIEEIVENKPIFGQSVSIYYEKKCWLGGERFQINVGTCGSHDLLPEERGYTMADFYIGIGKLHANTELLETIKDALFYYAERIADIKKEVRELDELIKNPTRA